MPQAAQDWFTAAIRYLLVTLAGFGCLFNGCCTAAWNLRQRVAGRAGAKLLSTTEISAAACLAAMLMLAGLLLKTALLLFSLLVAASFAAAQSAPGICTALRSGHQSLALSYSAPVV